MEATMEGVASLEKRDVLMKTIDQAPLRQPTDQPFQRLEADY